MQLGSLEIDEPLFHSEEAPNNTPVCLYDKVLNCCIFILTTCPIQYKRIYALTCMHYL